MTPLRILLVGLLLVAGALVLLNPGPEKFEAFLRQDIAERAATDPDAADRVFLAERTGRAVGDSTDYGFEREDYRVASLYRVDLNADQPGGKWTFLGIAGWFVPTEQPDPAAAPVGPRAPSAAPPRPPGIPG